MGCNYFYESVSLIKPIVYHFGGGGPELHQEEEGHQTQAAVGRDHKVGGWRENLRRAREVLVEIVME